MSKVKNYSIGLILLTLLSKIIGFARELVISHFYGASELGDAYSFINSLVILVVIGIASSVMTAYIPWISGKSDDEQNGITFNITLKICLITLLMTAVCIIFAKQIINLLCSGFSDGNKEFAAVLFRCICPSFVCITLMYVFIGYLNVKGTFYINGIQLILTNAIAIVSIIVSGVSPSRLGVGYTFSYIIPLAACLFLVRSKGLNTRNKSTVSLEKADDFYLTCLVAFIGTNVVKINIMADRIYASRMGEGVVSSLNYGYTLVAIIPEVITFSLITIYYPRLSELFVVKEKNEYSRIATELISINILVLVPFTVVFYFLSGNIINILLNHGAFDDKAFSMTQQALKGYSLGMLPIGLDLVFCKLFFSQKRYVWPGVALVVAGVVNVLLNSITEDIWGLAMVTSVSLTVSTLIMILASIKNTLLIKWKRVVASALKVGLAASVMTGLFWVISLVFSGKEMSIIVEIIYSGITLCVSMVGYVFVLVITKESTICEFLLQIKNRVSERKRSD